MPLLNSNWTGRVPRTLKSAFGPYTDDRLHPMPEKQVGLTVDDVTVAVAVVIILLVAAGIALKVL